MKTSEFTCSLCNKTYAKDLSHTEFQKAKEFIERFPECKNDSTDVVCEICFQDFMKWFSKLTNNDKKLMRDKYNGT